MDDPQQPITGTALFAHLRRWVHQLAPVVVEPATGEPLLRAYLSALEGPADAGALYLAPIAAQVLRAPRNQGATVCIHSTETADAWVLRAPEARAISDARACVSLAHAQLHLRKASQAPDLQPAAPSLVLAVPGGLPMSNAFVFPVVAVAIDHCWVDTTEALIPGSCIPYVELVGERRVLREAAARVEHIMAWRLEDGTPQFRCRLGLTNTVLDESAYPYDLISDSPQVRSILQAASRVLAPGWLRWPTEQAMDTRVLEAGEDSALLECAGGRAATIRDRCSQRSDLHTPLRLGIEYIGLHFEADVRLIDRERDGWRVALPLTLRRRFQPRRSARVAVPPEDAVALRFRHPALDRTVTTRLRDIAFGGVSFYVEPAHVPVWQGLPLEEAVLTWRGRRARLGALEVLAVEDAIAGHALCRARTTSRSLVQDPLLIELLATLGHPEVRVHSGDDLSNMVALYRSAGLFAPHMQRNLKGLAATAQRVWQRLHTRAPDLIRTLVHPADAEPDGAVTTVRAWEHAWLYQHFVCVRPRVRGAAGKLQMAILDHVLPRPDGHFVVFFVKTDNHVMNAFYSRFIQATGTPESVSRRTIELWVCPPERAQAHDRADPPREKTIRVRSLKRADEAVVARAAERALGRMTAAALSFEPGQFRLPDTTRRMQRAGVLRTRRAFVVTQQQSGAKVPATPRFAIVEERADPGFNLTWMLNASWLLPIHPAGPGDDCALQAALAHVLQQPPQSPAGDRFLLVPPDLDASPIASAGFERVAATYVYVLNRAGLHRYFQYTAGRYGSLHARDRDKPPRPHP